MYLMFNQHYLTLVENEVQSLLVYSEINGIEFSVACSQLLGIEEVPLAS